MKKRLPLPKDILSTLEASQAFLAEVQKGYEAGFREVGERMREFRKTKNLSLRELAKRMEISPAHLSDMELGRRHYTANNCRKAFKAMGVEL